MQHHFGDSGDNKRGIIIFNSNENEMKFIQNPNWDIFRVIDYLLLFIFFLKDFKIKFQ